jgi:hypothetical protein
VRALAALAAALIIVVGGTLLTAWHQGGAASPSLRPDQWTGLEWHDITSASDGLYASDPWQSGGILGSGSVVIWSGGLAAVGMEGGVWTSQDGRTWSRDAGAPDISSLAAVGGELVGFASSNVCPAGSSSAPVCTPQSSEWVSSDGVKWQPVVTPFDNDVVLQVVTASGSLVIGATTSPGMAVGGFLGPNSAIYVTSDGLSWHKAEIPGDMADSSVTIGSMRKGFVASGFLPDPQGTVVWYTGGSPIATVTGFDRQWESPNGLTWTAVPGDASGQSIPSHIYSGALGDSSLGNGSPTDDSLHSTDDVTWQPDDDQIMQSINGIQPSSTGLDISADGRHILVEDGWNPTFFVTEGDGHWQELAQGGDIGSLPGGGPALVLPNGVLCQGGGRLFFGAAVSGSPVTGALRPAATITMPPSPAPAGETPTT